MQIFCDQSSYKHIAADSSKNCTYMIIGSLWMSQEAFYDFEQKVLKDRNDSGIWEEVKCDRINAGTLPKRLEFSRRFLEMGLKIPDLKIALIHYRDDGRYTRTYYKGDKSVRDLAFLKMLLELKSPYFSKSTDQFLILHDNYSETKEARVAGAGQTFTKILKSKSGRTIKWFRPADSKICSALQLVDLITGLVTYRFQHQGVIPDKARGELIEVLETRYKRKLYEPSWSPSSVPYNLFFHQPRVPAILSKTRVAV